MRGITLAFIGLTAAAAVIGLAHAQQVELGGRSILEVAPKLKPSEYVWAPQLSPEGPALVTVNLQTQRLVLFRNGVPIAASTVSTGAPGHETPTGVFTILQKREEHYSKTYGNAPMPNMQRLTWKGVALHAGKLPGFPASHGCIRLPAKFSALLFGATKLGMTVVITSLPAVPLRTATPELATVSSGEVRGQYRDAPFEWHPERSTTGIVSVVVSLADRRAVVMRGGVEIGSAPAGVGGQINGAMAYVLRAWDDKGMAWLRLQFSGSGAATDVAANEGERFDVPAGFRQALLTALRPGSVIIVTPESLKAGSTGTQLTVID